VDVAASLGLSVSRSPDEFDAPERTGVYIMRNAAAEILYIGKANNLRVRINQYLRLQDSREMVPRLVGELDSIEFILTTSEKEALLLERQLIHRLRPKYNVLLLDDKQYLLVRVDGQSAFPRLELVRRRKRDGATYFGPFPGAKIIRQYVRLLARTCQLRTCRDRAMSQRVRPCMRHQLGWCTAPCVFPDRNEDYQERLGGAVELLGSRRQEAARVVEDRMLKAADNEQFEEAARYRDLLLGLRKIWGQQHVTLATPLDTDVFAVFHGPLGGAIYVLHMRDSSVAGSSSFFNESLITPETLDLESIVYQFYDRREPPSLVLGEFTTDGWQAAAVLLAEEHNRKIEFAHPRRGQKRALLEIAEKNAAQVYEEKSKAAQARHELRDNLVVTLNLPVPIEVVDCIDISSFQGSDAVGSVAVARDGMLARDEYRCFHIKGETHSDIDMMQEVVRRRIKQLANRPEPRLILVDGGRAHLAQVRGLFPANRPLFPAAIAKARPEQGLPYDRIYLPHNREAVPLEPDSRLLLFISGLRDEAHRFGLDFHRKTRKKRTLTSPLLSIPGIGKKRRMQLVKHFGSFKAIKDAKLHELLQVSGLPKQLAHAIFTYFHDEKV
jgi:excinuclease ABC subunit C